MVLAEHLNVNDGNVVSSSKFREGFGVRRCCLAGYRNDAALKMRSTDLFSGYATFCRAELLSIQFSISITIRVRWRSELGLNSFAERVSSRIFPIVCRRL